MNRVVSVTTTIKEARIFINSNPLLKSQRFLNDLEVLVAAGIAQVLDRAGIRYPLNRDDISLYLFLDRGIEQIKDDFLLEIINGDITMASPLLFPYTAPNTITSRATILFGLKGECISFPVTNNDINMLKYISIFFNSGVNSAIIGYTKTSLQKKDHSSITVSFFEGRLDSYNRKK